MIAISRFKAEIKQYYKSYGRHRMPWRQTRDPYKILVSEIMLQQTQVGRVVPFYENFIKRFPDFKTLAKAPTREVLTAWQGLGYNRRALNLQKLSRIVLEKFNGKLPSKREDLLELPGIGPGTAGSLRVFVFNEPEVFLETNIRRVFIHFFFPANSARKSAKRVTDTDLHRYILRALDREHPREWYYALMDYGAMLGTHDRVNNANRRSAHYKVQSRFEGSNRELRGKILRIMLDHKNYGVKQLVKKTGGSKEKVKTVLGTLKKEGLL